MIAIDDVSFGVYYDGVSIYIVLADFTGVVIVHPQGATIGIHTFFLFFCVIWIVWWRYL
jgi:hypothetical protein